MASTLPVDLDYLAARLHGRRGHLAEDERLNALCRLRMIPDLAREVCPGARVTTARELQQRLVQQMVEELSGFAAQLSGPGAALMAWLRVRLQIENLKVLFRAFATGKSSEVARQSLFLLPDDLALDTRALTAADSVTSFIEATPAGILREGLIESIEDYREEPELIVLEAALDRAYFRELVKRTRALPREGRADSLAIVKQEVDTFHLMLVARGRFTYGVPDEQLAGIHVGGAGISADRFRRMLNAASLREAAELAIGLAISRLPPERKGVGEGWADLGADTRYAEDPYAADPDTEGLDAADLETLAWSRYLHLARRAFRRNHMRLGAVVAFTAIRRVEVANLISLSEGIRTGMAPDAIRRRLVSSDEEAWYV